MYGSHQSQSLAGRLVTLWESDFPGNERRVYRPEQAIGGFRLGCVAGAAIDPTELGVLIASEYNKREVIIRDVPKDCTNYYFLWITIPSQFLCQDVCHGFSNERQNAETMARNGFHGRGVWCHSAP